MYLTYKLKELLRNPELTHNMSIEIEHFFHIKFKHNNISVVTSILVIKLLFLVMGSAPFERNSRLFI